MSGAATSRYTFTLGRRVTDRTLPPFPTGRPTLMPPHTSIGAGNKK